LTKILDEENALFRFSFKIDPCSLKNVFSLLEILDPKKVNDLLEGSAIYFFRLFWQVGLFAFKF
jgi:hypothetical protein